MDEEAKKRLYFTITKAKSSEPGVVEGIVATSAMDRQGEKIDLKGLDIKTYMETSGVVLFGHDYWGLPIGKTLSLRKKGEELIAQFKLAIDVLPLAAQVYDLILGNYLKGLSIGFIGKEWDEENVTWLKSEMLEFSVVPVPANSQAMITAKSQGVKTDLVDQFAEKMEKGVIPYKETPKAPKDENWDAGSETSAADTSDLKAMCAWFDSDNPDIKGSYKLPHHHQAGGHAVVWRGVAAAMAALNGGRGGVNIPSGDRQGVYNHLSKHYAQFDETPPDLKSIEEIELKEEETSSEIETLQSLVPALKEQVSALASTIASMDTEKNRDKAKKRRLILVTAKKNAQIVDRQVELVIAGLKKTLELEGTDT